MPNHQTRIWILLVLISLSILITGFTLGERQGLLLGLILALSINALVWHFSHRHWIDVFKAKLVEGQDPWGLNKSLQESLEKARIHKPEIYIAPLNLPTSFSVGRNPNRGKIVITAGLIKAFDEAEIKAVLAHELAKIKRGDTLSHGAASGLLAPVFSVLTMLDFIAETVTFKWLKKPFSRIINPLLVFFMRGLISKHSYYETDKLASHWIKSPELMAKTLWKLRSYTISQPLEVPLNSSHFFIVNPLTKTETDRYFLMQPSVQDRIQHLVGRFPV